MSLLDKLKDLLFEEEKGKAEPKTEEKKVLKPEAKPAEIEFDFKQIVPTLSALLKEKYTYYFALIPVLILGFWIRIQNLDLIKGKYLLELDSYAYFRYASEILAGEYGVFDTLRRAPIGTGRGSDFFPYLLAAWDKLVMSFGQPQIFAHVIYPVVFGTIGFIFFFLFVKELFNPKVALIATAFLAVAPAYLFRTVAGFADHEAMAMVFMFSALWTFVLALKEENLKKKYLFAALSGILTFLMAVTWIGFPFLTLPIAGFAVISLLFNKAAKQFTQMYSIWAILFISPFLILKRFGTLSSVGLFIPIIALIALWVNLYYSKLKASNYLQRYIPKNLQALLVTVIIGLILNLFIKIVDFSHLAKRIAQPAEASGRVAHTISEIIGGTDLYGQFGLLLVLGAAAVIYLVYLTFNDYKKTAAFSIPLLIFLIPAFFREYPLSAYLNLLILLAIIISAEYLYFYNKQNSEFFAGIKQVYFLPLSFIVFVAYMAKSAARFSFLFTPFISLSAAFCIVSLIIYALKRPENSSKFAGLLLILFVAFLVFSNAQETTKQASHSGSNLPGAWEQTFTWIRENTPKDAIVTHWWDYGYWTQTIGERASTHDGGTHGEYTLYILGRYGMTAPNPEDALTFFKTYKVDYLLYSEEEIGKYHAFAYIGSDKDFDRRSTIGAFALQQEQEVRNGTKLIYGGQWGLDKDVVINNKVYAEENSAVLGFTIDRQAGALTNPIAYLSDGSAPVQIPISCICIAGQCREIGAANALNGCIVIIPFISSPTEANEIGAAFYLSEKVKDGLFARLYIKGEQPEGFEKVYSDNVPLALYQGRIIGPKVIWKITPPVYIEEDPILLSNNSQVLGYEKDFRRNFEE